MINFDLVANILGAGFTGFGFLLAYLAFRLLRKEQEKSLPAATIIRAIYVFMSFSVLLCLIAVITLLAPQAISQENDVNILKSQISQLKGTENLYKQTCLMIKNNNWLNNQTEARKDLSRFCSP